MSEKVLKIAFIGGGGIAKNHAKWLSKFDDVRIVAVAEVSAETNTWWETEYDVPTFTDYHKMLAEIKPDAVDICTPNFLHYQPGIDALKAGAHVFVEKPMAMNADECQEMIDVAQETGRKGQILLHLNIYTYTYTYTYIYIYINIYIYMNISVHRRNE